MPIRFSLLALALLAMPITALASTGAKEPEQLEWRFDGMLGKFDQPSVQRGLQVYKEVCAACHGLKRVPFRRLTDVGFSEAEVKAFAAEYQIHDGPNDEGEMFDRPGRPSDKFPSPYLNDNAARASNNGGLPPDLSLIIKARPDGANYVHALLTGYESAKDYRCIRVSDGKCTGFEPMSGPAPERPEVMDEHSEGDMGRMFRCVEITHSEEVDAETGEKTPIEACHELTAGMYFNPHFPGGVIKMPPPVSDDQVTYQDGTKATKDQIARDVVNFLQWAAEPEMEARKRMGIKVLMFLAVMTGVFYAAKKRIWSDLH